MGANGPEEPENVSRRAGKDPAQVVAQKRSVVWLLTLWICKVMFIAFVKYLRLFLFVKKLYRLGQPLLPYCRRASWIPLSLPMAINVRYKLRRCSCKPWQCHVRDPLNAIKGRGVCGGLFTVEFCEYPAVFCSEHTSAFFLSNNLHFLAWLWWPLFLFFGFVQLTESLIWPQLLEAN